MRNEVVITQDKVLEVTDNVLNLTLRQPELLIKIKGQVLLNQLFDNSCINQKLTIELAPQAHLLFNILDLKPILQRQIIITQDKDSKLNLNYAYLTKTPTQLELTVEVKGNNNNNNININAVTLGEGQTEINVTGTINQKTIANHINENIKCLTFNKATNKIRPNLIVKSNECTVNHNATISPVDPEAAFYLASKGLDNKAVKKLIIKGFLTTNLALDQQLKTQLIDYLETEVGLLES